MTESYKPNEMMTIAAARGLRNDAVCFVGIGMPSAACNLARLTHAPDITLIYESGTLATKPNVLPLSIGDGELCDTALTTVSVPEMFRYWLQGGRITLGFLGGAPFAELDRRLPDWIAAAIGMLETDAVLVTPHWGPNMTAEPVRHVRAAAEELVRAGATLVAGHSAHVVQGVAGRVLYDLGDFLDDYAVDPGLRNDLGMLFLVTLDEHGPIGLEAVPLKLDFCYTRFAEGEDAAWIRGRFGEACRALGTAVGERDGRLTVAWR